MNGSRPCGIYTVQCHHDLRTPTTDRFQYKNRKATHLSKLTRHPQTTHPQTTHPSRAIARNVAFVVRAPATVLLLVDPYFWISTSGAGKGEYAHEEEAEPGRSRGKSPHEELAKMDRRQKAALNC